MRRQNKKKLMIITQKVVRQVRSRTKLMNQHCHFQLNLAKRKVKTSLSQKKKKVETKIKCKRLSLTF